MNFYQRLAKNKDQVPRKEVPIKYRIRLT